MTYTPESLRALAAEATPGPWFVGTMTGLTYIIDAPPRPNALDAPVGGLSGPDVVAKVNWDDMPEQANARLIAAAPDLALGYADALDRLAAADALISECGEYLKEGETPRQRMDRDHKDVLALMELLVAEKNKVRDLKALIGELVPLAWDYRNGTYLDRQEIGPKLDAALARARDFMEAHK